MPCGRRSGLSALRTLGVPLSEESAEALSATGRARRALRELGTWLNEVYEAGVVAEKRNDQILGYRSITAREGDTESPRSASLLFDRREALALIEQRARRAFPSDARGVRLVTRDRRPVRPAQRGLRPRRDRVAAGSGPAARCRPRSASSRRTSSSSTPTSASPATSSSRSNRCATSRSPAAAAPSSSIRRSRACCSCCSSSPCSPPICGASCPRSTATTRCSRCSRC